MSQPNSWVGYRTIVRKEVTRIVRIWGQTVVPPAITMTLYFIIFGNLIGRRIGEMGGFDYMQFIVPGLVMMSVITNSYGNMVSSFFGAKFGHHIEELLVSPLPSSIILAGYVTGALVRGLMVGAVVILVSLFFTRLEVQHPLIMVSVLLLTSVVFAMAGMVNAIFAQKFDDIAIIPTFVLTPLTYLGGCSTRSACCRNSGKRSPLSIRSCTWSTGSGTESLAFRTSISCGLTPSCWSLPCCFSSPA